MSAMAMCYHWNSLSAKEMFHKITTGRKIYKDEEANSQYNYWKIRESYADKFRKKLIDYMLFEVLFFLNQKSFLFRRNISSVEKTQPELLWSFR